MRSTVIDPYGPRRARAITPMRRVADTPDDTRPASATIQYRVESRGVIETETDIPNPSTVLDRRPEMPRGPPGTLGQSRIVCSTADSAAESATCFAPDIATILVSSVTARKTLAMSAAMSITARSADRKSTRLNSSHD